MHETELDGSRYRAEPGKSDVQMMIMSLFDGRQENALYLQLLEIAFGMNRDQLYPELKGLMHTGLIENVPEKRFKGVLPKDPTRYRLTDKGLEFLTPEK